MGRTVCARARARGRRRERTCLSPAGLIDVLDGMEDSQHRRTAGYRRDLPNGAGHEHHGLWGKLVSLDAT